jgi:hypothetical protein
MRGARRALLLVLVLSLLGAAISGGASLAGIVGGGGACGWTRAAALGVPACVYGVFTLLVVAVVAYLALRGPIRSDPGGE